MAGFFIPLSIYLFRFTGAVFKQAGVFRARRRDQGAFQESTLDPKPF
jgi:hypothetical protein